MSTDSVHTFEANGLNRSGNRRGRKTEAIVAHIEAHVEEIVALTEDAALLEESRRRLRDIIVAIVETVREMRAGRLSLVKGTRRIEAFSRDIAQIEAHLADRAEHLRGRVIPEVCACYRASEAAIAKGRAA